MKIATVSLLDYAIAEGKSRTAQLGPEHKPEMMPDGWIRFWCDGQWHRVPPTLVRRITEQPEPALKALENAVEQTVLMPHTESIKDDSAPKRRGRPPKL